MRSVILHLLILLFFPYVHWHHKTDIRLDSRVTRLFAAKQLCIPISKKLIYWYYLKGHWNYLFVMISRFVGYPLLFHPDKSHAFLFTYYNFVEEVIRTALSGLGLNSIVDLRCRYQNFCDCRTEYSRFPCGDLVYSSTNVQILELNW